MSIRPLILALSLAFASTPLVAQPVARVPFKAVPDFVGYVSNEFVVAFDASTGAAMSASMGTDGRPVVSDPAVQQVVRELGVERFAREFPGRRAPKDGVPDLALYYKVRIPAGENLDDAIAVFDALPGVDHVEKIGMHTLSATPNDPYYQDSPNPSFDYDQWHYWGTHSIDADLAWDITSGNANVVVGILDSGVRYFHVDLGGDSPQWGPDAPFAGGNMWINSAETPNDGIDNDANGYIDDTIGWDFVSSAGGAGVTCLDQDCSGVDNDPDDGDGHGTHVSGTVGAITNNNRIVAGVAGGFSDGTTAGTGNGVRILPLRIGYHARYLGVTTGIVRMDWAAEAMTYVADLVDSGVDVTAINCSWGSSDTGGLGAAVDNLLAHDVVIVHSAGNSNSTTADFLGNKAGVMNVAATDSTGAGADFTNSGSWVDVAAPGVDILSTYRNPDDPDPTAHYLALLSGTSMSSPHVAGIVALLESCDPTLSGPDKFSLIVNNTTPYTDARDLGSGIANAYLALTAAACGTPPPPVAAFSASPIGGEAPLEVDFTDLSTGGPTAWLWEFGDGDTAMTQNPSHVYAAPDTYTVSLVASNSAGADTLTVVDYIEVTPTITAARGPDAAFEARVSPNPFNPATTVHVTLPGAAAVVIDVYDVSGRPVRRLAAGRYGAGAHAFPFDGRDDDGRVLPSGVYLCRVTAGDATRTRKLVLLK